MSPAMLLWNSEVLKHSRHDLVYSMEGADKALMFTLSRRVMLLAILSNTAYAV